MPDNDIPQEVVDALSGASVETEVAVVAPPMTWSLLASSTDEATGLRRETRALPIPGWGALVSVETLNRENSLVSSKLVEIEEVSVAKMLSPETLSPLGFSLMGWSILMGDEHTEDE